MSVTNQTASDYASEGNASESIFRSLMGRMAFIDVVRVEAVDGEYLTVRSLLQGLTTEMTKIESQQIYDIPYLRLKRGNSAVIMDPVVGDIGLMAICDKDVSSIKESKTDSVPSSLRTHSKADGVYLTGIASLNPGPVQYARFTESGIDIVSPVNVQVSSPDISFNASTKISLNSPIIEANGQLTQGAGSYAGDATFGGSITATGEVTGNGIQLSSHIHGGVESGDSTTSGPE